MDTLFTSLSSVLVIVLMVAVGYLFGRKGWMKAEHKGLIIKLIINVGMPALCFNNVFSNFTRESIASMGYYLLLPLGSMLISIAFSILLCRLLKIEKRREGGFVVMCSLSNTIFVGLPMCKGLFGDEAVMYVMFFYIVNTTLFWTLGNYLLMRSGEGNGGHVELKKLLTPPLISIAVFIPLFLIGFEPPKLLLSLSSYLSGIVTPLALLYVGFLLCEGGIRNIRIDRGLSAVMVIRFLIAPAITLGLCALMGVGGIARETFVIESAMPVMTQAVVVAGNVGADEKHIAEGMSLTTLACFVVVPLLMFVISLL